jgi:hypothetical protein
MIPSSALVRKKVLDDVGLFDEKLRTAEDLDLHLRIARKYKIGLIDEPLFNYVRGSDNLSLLSCTYDDHVYVMERFLSSCRGEINKALMKNALFETYITAANGKFWLLEWRTAMYYLLKANKCIASINDILTLCKMCAKGIKYFRLRNVSRG